MRIAKLDMQLREKFIKEEFKNNPKATGAEINKAVKKKFGVKTALKNITAIRDSMNHAATKVPLPKLTVKDQTDIDILDLAKQLKESLVSSPYVALMFYKEGDKVSLRWKKEIVQRKFEEGIL